MEYGERLKGLYIDPTINPKSILTVTNEPGLVCSMISMIAPKFTPYLVGVSDNDTRRVRRDFIKKFNLEGKVEIDAIDIGIVGDHDVYGRVVWGDQLVEYLETLGISISRKEVHDFFSNDLYSVITRRIKEGKSANTELAETLIQLSNAAIKSLDRGNRVIGSHYNSMFIGQGYKGFTVTRQGFSRGRAVPLQVNYPTKDIRMKYVKGIDETKVFRDDTLKIPEIERTVKKVIGKGIRMPHVEEDDTNRKQPSKKSFPKDLKQDGLRAYVSVNGGAARVEVNRSGNLVAKNVYKLRTKRRGDCSAIETLNVSGRELLCLANMDEVRIYDTESGKENSVAFEQTNSGGINFVSAILPKHRNDKINGMIPHSVMTDTAEDLEQILLINHAKYGLFGISMYEISVDSNIRIEKEDISKMVVSGGHCLIKDRKRTYKSHDNKLYSAKIKEGKLTVEEHELGYRTVQDQESMPEVPLIPYGPDNEGYVFLKRNNNFKFDIPELETIGLGEKVSAIEVDGNNIYIGTNKGKVILCKNVDSDPSYEVIYDNKSETHISCLQTFEYNGKSCIAFLNKRVTIGYDDGTIEVIVDADNENRETTKLSEDLRVNWFSIDNDYLLINYNGDFAIRNLAYDRVEVRQNKGRDFGLKLDTADRDMISVNLGEIISNCSRHIRVGNISYTTKQTE